MLIALQATAKHCQLFEVAGLGGQRRSMHSIHNKPELWLCGLKVDSLQRQQHKLCQLWRPAEALGNHSKLTGGRNGNARMQG